MWDSNPRPPGPQPGALTSWAKPTMSLFQRFGVPEGIRTPDPRLRRAMLYPAELLAQNMQIALLWSGWWESDPRGQLGRLELYHWATPAFVLPTCLQIITHQISIVNENFTFLSKNRKKFQNEHAKDNFAFSCSCLLYIQKHKCNYMLLFFTSQQILKIYSNYFSFALSNANHFAVQLQITKAYNKKQPKSDYFSYFILKWQIFLFKFDWTNNIACKSNCNQNCKFPNERWL